MKYECAICGYSSDDRSRVHEHHIQPKAAGGTEDMWNKVVLCPNCHTKVYVPGTLHGMHSIPRKDSIVINCWRNDHSLLEWKTFGSEELCYTPFKTS